MARDLLTYLPEILREIQDFQSLTKAEQPEISSLQQAASGVLAAQFVATAGDDGISRWEKLLGVTPKATASLADRRFLVQLRVGEQLPYTLQVLRQQLAALCGGEEGYSLVVDGEQYALTVQVALTAKSNFSDVGELLKRIVPANLVVSLMLKYNQHQTLAPFTHQHLAASTYDQLRNEVLTYGNEHAEL